MNKEIQNLYPSLVGSSIEFSFKKKIANATPIEQNIQSARKRIERDVEDALAVGGELCVMLLAELTNYYRKEIYYMAVRSAIEMRRYRPAILDYLQLEVSERAERLQSVLAEKLRGDKNRGLKISIAKYFLGTYPSRLPDFKKLFTREEYMIVA